MHIENTRGKRSIFSLADFFSCRNLKKAEICQTSENSHSCNCHNAVIYTDRYAQLTDVRQSLYSLLLLKSIKVIIPGRATQPTAA